MSSSAPVGRCDGHGPSFLIPHSRPYLGDDLETAAHEVARSGMIGPGRQVERFEAEMALLHDAPGAVATNSGTSALHLALLALGVGTGDEVVLPSYVCTAVLNAVRYVGAVPVLADLDEVTLNIDPCDVRSRLTNRTKAIIAPHMLGNPADIPGLQRFGLPIIEDCAQSLGATIGGRLVGSLGDLSVFSFYATKVITTGEGGMVVARRSDLVEAMRDLRDYDEKADYVPRYSYHLSDLAAAIGHRQLRRLPQLIARRRALAELYSDELRGVFELPRIVPGAICYRYVVRTASPGDKQRAFAEARIQTKRPVYAPLHHYIGGRLPKTDRVYRTALSIPLYPALEDLEARYLVSIARGIAHKGPDAEVPRASVAATV